MGIETAECILNWSLLKETILADIAASRHIKVCTNTYVQSVSQKDNPFDGYNVKFLHEENRTEELSADFLVNATWEQINFFNQQLGIEPPETTNRLKIMIEIDLPETLKHEHCMFFCFGPHASFTNYGNGSGFITAEKFTNFAQSMGLTITPEMEMLLYGLPSSATEEEKAALKKLKEDIAQKILQETTKYIPAMKDARIKVVNGEHCIYSGIVRTPGIVEEDLSSPSNSIHQRRESGVKLHSVNGMPLFENASNKLLYGPQNGQEVASLVLSQIEYISLLTEMINEAMDNLVEPEQDLAFRGSMTSECDMQPRSSTTTETGLSAGDKLSPFSGDTAKGITEVLGQFIGSLSGISSQSAKNELLKKVIAPMTLSAFFYENKNTASKAESETVRAKNISNTFKQAIQAKQLFLQAVKQKDIDHQKPPKLKISKEQLAIISRGSPTKKEKYKTTVDAHSSSRLIAI